MAANTLLDARENMDETAMQEVMANGIAQR
jgi:hypothetical protein